MAGVNKVIILGNLGADPELRSSPSGITTCRLSIATSMNWTDKNSGEKKEKGGRQEKASEQYEIENLGAGEIYWSEEEIAEIMAADDLPEYNWGVDEAAPMATPQQKAGADRIRAAIAKKKMQKDAMQKMADKQQNEEAEEVAEIAPLVGMAARAIATSAAKKAVKKAAPAETNESEEVVDEGGGGIIKR